MKRSLRLPAALVLLAAFLFIPARPARASIPTGTEIVLIFVAVGAVGAAIGVGVYYAVRKAPSITGCAAGGPTGLSLRNESDQKTFLLIGDTAAIHPGDRVRVKGKKKKDASGATTFLVDRLTRDFGSCKLSRATP